MKVQKLETIKRDSKIFIKKVMPLKSSQAVKLSILSLSIGILIFILKLITYFLTQSTAIYSDAMESIINIISAFTAYTGSKIALKPPDKCHPYGHTKIEYLTSIVEGILILGASFSIFYKTFQNFTQKGLTQYLGLSFSLLFITLILNLLLSLFIYRQGKRENSPLLTSHAIHLFTDVLTTIGVLIGFWISLSLNLWILDRIIALLIGISILYLGFKILKTSCSSLLDESLSQNQIDSILKIIKETLKNHQHKENIYEIHDLKTRKSGRKGFVEFHLTVSGHLPVKEAHLVCDEIEEKIKERYPEISVTIHIEPEEKAKEEKLF
ncbi:MAG: cation diffusion facilitator family transporter [Thermodesulfobacteriaceae bacterium]|nr:cation diffusion facilitator family transporter [Thermodesulfobacteriaceae bacterium]